VCDHFQAGWEDQSTDTVNHGQYNTMTQVDATTQGYGELSSWMSGQVVVVVVASVLLLLVLVAV